MFHYYLNRGLDAVEILANNFKNKKWLLPDLICGEVVDVLYNHKVDIEFYQINSDFSWAAKVTGNDPKIFYVIDYFGQESNLGRDAPPNTVVIRDSVWFPYPFTPVEHNQIWFNSLRKIIRGAKGSSVISPYRIQNASETPGIFYHPTLTWQEIDKRFENYYHCKEIFSEYEVPGHRQQFPSVFPIRLKNCDRVLEQLDTPLPGMWKNKYNLPSPLYKELTFIPLDSRFDKDRLTALADKIEELNR